MNSVEQILKRNRSLASSAMWFDPIMKKSITKWIRLQTIASDLGSIGNGTVRLR